MGRLCLLEEITSKEMVFSTRGEKVSIPIGGFAIDHLEQQLTAGEPIMLEVDIEKKRLVGFDEQIIHHEREIENIALLRADNPFGEGK
ncbi:hypothetical protein P5815_29935 [Bacillus cereus]|uniref:hypothetical protein n=1 Tax=Bacillus cereus group TaxID=86661 RepID=UPI00156B6AB5|nr:MULTISPECIES: hypothetical protein [Bacillus cereus group]MDA2230971.1 hypothetical protein [Bacillus cereus group sp. Bc227]MDF9524719.1 hypothetical protein [Bacillus cereus]MDF9564432.1 hypothetical protein [Bacillus cereus]NRQ71818.1 hypothetical protein [Bacillus cereus]